LSDWFKQNEAWTWVICGLIFGGVFILSSKMWPTFTLVMLGIAAVPHIYGLFGGEKKLPAWLVASTAAILASFASGSIIAAIIGV
jgi:hypothetical protein